MKILHLTYWYPTEKQPLKGVFIKKHIHAAHKAGCNVHVLNLSIEHASVFFEKSTRFFTDEAGVPVTQILVKSRFYKWLHLLLFLHKKWIVLEFHKLHAKQQFTLLHGHVLYPAAIWTHHLSRISGIPYILTEHWSKLDRFFSKSLFAKQGKKAFENARCITAVSSFLSEMIQKHANVQQMHIIGNVLNDAVFHFREKNLAPEEISFTAVAHWYPPKRPDLIFNSLQSLAERHRDKIIILNMIGEGPLLESLKHENRNFTIHYLGQKTASEISSLLAKSNYFLHASETETFSVVIAEALATGTPVLASRRGAIPDLIIPECGELADNKVDCWIEGLEKLISRKFEHQKISESVLKFRESEIGLQLKKLYEETDAH